MDFPSHVTFEEVKLWSCLELGCKVKNIYTYVFLTKHKCSQIFHVTLNSVPQPGQSKPFQCFCSASVGRYLCAKQPVPVPKWPLPPHLPAANTQNSHGKGHPNSRDIYFHNTELLQWKLFPLVLSMSNCGRLPIEQTTLKQSPGSSARRPRRGSPSPGAASRCTEPAPLRLGEAVGRAGCLCLSSSPFRNLF